MEIFGILSLWIVLAIIYGKEVAFPSMEMLTVALTGDEPVEASATKRHRPAASPVVVMRLVLITLALVAVTAFATSGALAQTSHQVAITKFAAKVVYVENRCPHLKANTAGLIMVGKAHNVLIDDWRPLVTPFMS